MKNNSFYNVFDFSFLYLRLAIQYRFQIRCTVDCRNALVFKALQHMHGLLVKNNVIRLENISF